MTNIFVWDPTADQIYDGTYINDTLTQENTDEGYSAYSFYKINADFVLAIDTNSTLNLKRDIHPLDTRDHIHWEVDVSGKSIDIVSGYLNFSGAYNDIATQDSNVTILGSEANILKIKIASKFLISLYNNVLFSDCIIDMIDNSLLNISSINNVMFMGEGSEINVSEESRFTINAYNSVLFSDLKINLSSHVVNISSFADSGALYFYDYKESDESRINIFENCKVNWQFYKIEINDAKIHIKDNASINLRVDNLILTSGGRFTLSDNSNIHINGSSESYFNFTSAVASTYPKEMFYFNVPGAVGNAKLIFDGIDDGSGLSLLFNYALLSVNGNTDETYLRGIMNFDSTVIDNFENPYPQLTISIKKDAIINN